MLLVTEAWLPFLLCVILLIMPASALMITWAATTGWRLREETHLNPLDTDQRLMLGTLRWNVYEPLLTSGYLVLQVFVAGGIGSVHSQLNFLTTAPFPDNIFRLMLLLFPMLVLLTPLRFVNHSDPFMRSCSVRLLGLGLLRIVLTVTTFWYLLPMLLGLPLLIFSIRWVTRWHRLIATGHPYKPISVGKEGRTGH